MQMAHWQPEFWRMRGVPPAPNPPSTYTVFFNISITLPFLECHVIRIIQYVALRDWLLSLNNTH